MNTDPYWKKVERVDYPSLTEDLDVDVLIIGGGITGVSAAHLIAETGLKVVLVEKFRLGDGDTLHTTAHLTYMTDTRLSELIHICGRREAEIAWNAGSIAMDHISAAASRLKVDVGFATVDGYLSASREADRENEIKTLKEEARQAAEWGMDVEYFDRTPVLDLPGIRFGNQAKFHPMLYLQAVAAEAKRLGALIFENTLVSQFNDDGKSVQANDRRVSYRHVIIATHVPLQGNTGTVGAALFQTKLASYSTYAIAVEFPKGTLEEMIWSDTAEPFNYLRVDRQKDRDVVIFGGEDHKTGQVIETEECFSKLEQRLTNFLGPFTLLNRWSGQVVETVDGLPFIGLTEENQFIATGFSGNGMTLGVVAAMMAKDHVLGQKSIWKEIFDPCRKHVSALANYLAENVDYPCCMVKDRVGLQEDTGYIEEGEGRVVKRRGQIIATCRDEKGELHECSGICPHLGCVVAWNSGEKTWDCPCHGSRFLPDGTLIAGPAETNLTQI